jgi:hypothetical protein
VQDTARPSPTGLDADEHVGPQLECVTGPARLGAMPIFAHRPFGGNATVVERRLAHQVDLDRAVDAAGGRTSAWLASWSNGGRVCGVSVSSPRRGPIVSASRTTTQPVGVFHDVTSVLVPGS